MNLLALDLGVSTGWALREAGRVESGTQTFALDRGESPGMRYLRFRRWLETLAGDGAAAGVRVGLIVYEAPHHRGGAATEIAAGLATRVQEFCAVHGLEHAAVHSARLKKWATGRGNADKGAMLATVRARWKPDVGDDDEADALALLHFALDRLVPGVAAGSAPASPPR